MSLKGLTLVVILLSVSSAIEAVPPGKPQVVDPSIQLTTTNVSAIKDILVLPDGRIAFAAAGFAAWGVLNPDGSSNVFADVWSKVGTNNTLALSKDRVMLTGGGLPFEPPVGRFRDESGDFSFFTQVANAMTWFREPVAASKILIQNPADDIVAAGAFHVIGQSNLVGLLRLRRTGILDREFDSQGSSNLFLLNAALTRDGRILGAYSFTNFDGTLADDFGRWLANGKRDTNYAAVWVKSLSTNARVRTIVRQPGLDTFLAAAEFTRDDQTFTRLILLDAEGLPTTLSADFPEITGTINAIGFCPAEAQPLGSGGYDQILLAGSFSRIGDTFCNNLASLSKKGEILWTFGPDEGPNGPLYAVTGQTDGRILIGGGFDAVSGFQTRGIARLQGLAATGKTYVFWERTEYVAYEKLGSVEVTLQRSGNLEAAQTITIVPQSAGNKTRLGTNRITLRFNSGESRKRFSIPILQNSIRDGLVSIVLKSELTAGEENLTYNPATISVLDDEIPGTLDPTFSSPPFPITAMKPLPDGKMLLGYVANGPRVGRMNPDGTLEVSFATNGIPFLSTNGVPYPYANATVNQIDLTSSGQIYAAGSFVSQLPWGLNLIARLNPDGTLDRYFSPQISGSLRLPSENPLTFVVATNANVLILQGNSSAFSMLGALGDQGPFLLSAVGSIYPDFNRHGTAYFPNAFRAEAQGSAFLIAGRNRNGLLRLAPTGALDTNFLAKPGFSLTPPIVGTIYTFFQAPDGLLVAGDFSSINGAAASALAFLNATNGQVLRIPPLLFDGAVRQALQRFDGKIYIAGPFTRVNGEDRYHLARLNADGTLDLTFDPGLQFKEEPLIQLQIDGRILAYDGVLSSGLNFNTRLVRLEDDPVPGILHLVSNRIQVSESASYAIVEIKRVGGSSGPLSGTLQTFDGSAVNGMNYVGTNLVVTFGDGEFRKIIQIPVLVDPALTGNKTFSVTFIASEISETATVLIKDDQIGTVPAGFTATVAGLNSKINDFTLLSDGSIIVGGSFTSIQGIAMTNLARLFPDFTVDTNFLVQGPAAPPISRLAVRPDGRVLLGGAFTNFGDNNWSTLMQLSADLRYDADFNDAVRKTWAGAFLEYFYDPVDLRLLPDGRLFVADPATVRLISPDGTRDISFRDGSSGNSGNINTVGTLADGSLLVGGSGGYQGQVLWHLFGDGSSDRNFSGLTSSSIGSNGSNVRSIAEDGAGGFYIGGNFIGLGKTAIGAGTIWRLAHVFGNGGLDLAYTPRVGNHFATEGKPVDGVNAMVRLSNGDLLVGGDFIAAELHDQPLLARVAPNGLLRDFRPDLHGTNIQKIVMSPDGSALVLGSITKVSGVKTGDLFKLSLVDELPPVVKILAPTNGASFQYSDAISLIHISAQAFDPDGFLKEVVLTVDGAPVSTNLFGQFELNPPAEGNHQLGVIARDDFGLSTANVVNISVTYLPFGLFDISVRLHEGEVIVTYSGPILQESADLNTWSDIQTVDGGFPRQYKATPADHLKFFRVKGR